MKIEIWLFFILRITVIMEAGLGLIISEVRYITGYNKTKQSMRSYMDSAMFATVNTTVEAHINKTILSTALKLRRILFNDTNKYFAPSDAKTIIDLFNHAARIPLFEHEKLESTCSGILRIISSFNMINKNKRAVHIKGDTKTVINDVPEKEPEA